MELNADRDFLLGPPNVGGGIKDIFKRKNFGIAAPLLMGR